MPHSIGWLIPHRLAFIQGEGLVTSQETQAINTWLTEHIHTSHQQTGLPVHVVIEIHEVISQPSLMEARYILTYMAELGLGDIVVVGHLNYFLQFMAKFMANLFQVNIQMYARTDQALAFLQAKDPHFTPLKGSLYPTSPISTPQRRPKRCQVRMIG
jgi:crotonobetainyl-CoA:carnitine CoA-transferase CaiB-like acyl-CoA transferase